MIKTTYKPLTDDQLPQAWEDWKQKQLEPKELPSEKELRRRLTDEYSL